MPTSKTFLTIVLALLTMVGPLGIDAYLPSFLDIGATFNASPMAVQQTLGAYTIGMSVMTLFYGTLSDSFGRRPVVMVSLLVFTITSALAALAGSLGMLIAVRVAQGLCAGAGMVIARAMVQDKFRGPEAQSMMALIMMVFGVAPAVAPVVGGWLQATFGWRSVFWFLAVFGALLLLLSQRVLRETLPKEQRTPLHLGDITANYLRSARSPRFMLMVVASGMAFFGLSLYVGAAPIFVMKILKQPETAFGWLFIPLVAGMVVGSGVASRLAHTVPTDRLIRIGFSLMALGVILSVAYTSSFQAAVPWAVLPLAVYTFGLALAMPGMTVATLSVFPTMRGLASSMQGFVQMLLFTIASTFVAPLLFDSPLKLALGHAAGTAIAIVLWELALKAKKPE